MNGPRHRATGRRTFLQWLGYRNDDVKRAAARTRHRRYAEGNPLSVYSFDLWPS